MIQNKPPLKWMIWHPHQGLWNSILVGAVRKIVPVTLISKAIIFAIILLDSFILLLRAVFTRISAVGISSIFSKAKVPKDISVLYLDAGTHKEGSELSIVTSRILPPICSNFDAYGFEASLESFTYAEKKFAGRANVHIVHKALAFIPPENGKLRLFKDPGSGIGDSLYRETDQFEDVEALRLSDFLAEQRLITDQRVILLRMNIEGAEYDVLRDLVKSGLAHRIDGYFGMWDDLSKIDVDRDNEFRAFAAENNIHTFTFNERDLKWSFRRAIIAYQVQTRIMQGVRRDR
jgi:FkbM family methyltransferase